MHVSHLRELHGLPVRDFPEAGEEAGLPAADAVAWRLAVVEKWGGERTEPFEELWGRFLAHVDPAGVRALVVGQWDPGDDSRVVVKLLAAAADRLTGLEALFLGDMEQEENEISWILQCDVTPVLRAYPGLRELGVRGGTELVFPPVRHEALRRLRFEAGGLPAEVVRGVADSDLPALEHLEMWLGVPDYEGDSTLADLEPLLTGERLPALRHLGLQNSVYQDEIAAALAGAPVVARLSSLALGLGSLTDEGAEALLHGQPITHLQRLDLHYHYLGDAMRERIRAALEPAGVEVDLGEPQGRPADDDVWSRYPAVTE